MKQATAANAAFATPVTLIRHGTRTPATTAISSRSVRHAFSSSSLFLQGRACRLVRGGGYCEAGGGVERLVIRSDAGTDPLEGSDEKLLVDLRDEGTPRQIVALSRVVRIGGARGVELLRESGALMSSMLKTRIAALDALGKLREPSEIGFLVSTLQTDKDHSVRAAAAGGLSNLADKDAAAALRGAAIQDDHFIVRYSAIVALGEIADLAAAPLLLPLVQNPNSPALEVAAGIDALGSILPANETTPAIIAAVSQHCTHPDDLIRAAVARTLVTWKTVPGVADTLSDMVDHEVGLGRKSFVLSLLQKLLEGDAGN